MSEPFRIKDFEQLKTSLLNYIFYTDNALTDFNVGSVMRTMLEAFAMEEEEEYFRTWQGIQNAIKYSILETFNFFPFEGSGSVGYVTFGRETESLFDILIPANTEIISPTGNKYVTLVDVTLLQNTKTISVAAKSLDIGVKTNINTLNNDMSMPTPINGVSWVRNNTTFTGGTDGETSDSTMKRFAMYINSLVRATMNSIEYGATLAKIYTNGIVTEEVKRVKVVEYSDNKGYVDVYIDNGAGTTSSALRNEAQKIINGYIDSNGNKIDGYKAAGVVATVSGVSKVDVDVTIDVTAPDINVVIPYLQNAISAYFENIGIGEAVNKEKLIADAFYAHPTITDVSVTLPASDVSIPATQVAVLRTLTII